MEFEIILFWKWAITYFNLLNNNDLVKKIAIYLEIFVDLSTSKTPQIIFFDRQVTFYLLGTHNIMLILACLVTTLELLLGPLVTFLPPCFTAVLWEINLENIVLVLK